MERAKKGEGLDRWLRMDRKKRREEAARLATLAKLGAYALEKISRMRQECNKATCDEQARYFRSGTALFVEDEARRLGLLSEAEAT